MLLKRLIFCFIVLLAAATWSYAQCTGTILDVEHVIESSGSQFKFITQYSCNGEVVDVAGQPCDNCKQGNRVGGDATLEDAKTQAQEAVNIHATNLNAKYKGNAEKLENEKLKIYATSKGVNVNQDIDQINLDLKSILEAEHQAVLKATSDNVIAILGDVKRETVGYSATAAKYEETFMNKKIEVTTDEKVVVSNSVLTP